MIKLRSGNCLYFSSNNFSFPGGERSIRIKEDICKYKDLNILADIRSSNDVMDLLLITDALKRATSYQVSPKLFMPYLPYARQDRICNPGEAFSLKVFTDLINAQNYSSVEIWDCHSDVGVALIDRCINISQVELIEKNIEDLSFSKILVSPDAGANKKVQAVAKALPKYFNRVIRADKIRDCATGEITDTVVYCDDLKGQDVLILDDIGDGLRTFVELGKKLKEKNAGKVSLYITHGIFSKGIDHLKEAIDEIYCARPWVENLPSNWQSYVKPLYYC